MTPDKQYIQELRAMLRTVRALHERIKLIQSVRVSPKMDESKDDFMSRCMGSAMMVSEFADTAQRYAVCERYWTEGPLDDKLFENPCWDGYEAFGLKPDGTPNCVPIDD